MALPMAPSCPRCAKPMEAGVVWVPGRYEWLKEPIGLYPGGDIMGKAFPWLPQNFAGWRCKACQMVLTDYSKVL
jgi:hypothetical protein